MIIPKLRCPKPWCVKFRYKTNILLLIASITFPPLTLM